MDKQRLFYPARTQSPNGAGSEFLEDVTARPGLAVNNSLNTRTNKRPFLGPEAPG
jgi:hypothetical protein